ncbi:hypothetical protein AXF42_Ash011820 [Apostasia shenzhenica]|uniref:Uncharacterized protein n=1 Tax=Apostasia shenzhenica TaxID=1088818 RepID=A0A2I0AW00_9ASPA|nr:hypothetical protein AXF42_Ash011820 [Apostasia shenzhenica]
MLTAARQALLCLAFFVMGMWALQGPWLPGEFRAAAIKAHSPETVRFIGRRPAPVPAEHFDSSERSIPSCPDPLHNR